MLLLAHSLALMVIALPYCIHLGTSSLWDSNEAFYAETPREMIETGNYLAPQFNYQPRIQKPPLTYWAILASYRLFGIREFSVRLPGALAAIGVILFVYGIARLLFTPRAALIAAVIAATTFRIFALARKLPIDILLMFWLLGTAYFLVRALQRSSRWNWFCAYFFAGCGFMTKGPIALVIPFGSYLLWALWARSFSLRVMHPLLGGFTLLAIVMPWYILIYFSHGWSYIATFFLRDNLGRFATESLGPSRGAFFYLATFAADFFPWCLLSLAAVVHLWCEHRSQRVFQELRYGFLLIWCCFVFLIFSFSKNKQEYYIAPIYPMLAVFLGGIGDTSLLWLGRIEARRLHFLWAGIATIISLCLVALSAALPSMVRIVIPGGSFLARYLPSVVIVGGAIFLLRYVLEGNVSRGLISVGISLWLLITACVIFYLPHLELLRPVKEFCKVIESEARAGDASGYFRATVPSMAYYLRRPIYEEFDAEAMVRRFQSATRIFCILSQQEYKLFAARQDVILHVLDRRPWLITQLRDLLDEKRRAERELILVSNRVH